MPFLVRMAAALLLRSQRSEDLPKIIGERTPGNIAVLVRLNEIFPEARIVHVVRDFSLSHPGTENRESHFRKGVAGDWVNHLSEGTLKNIESIAGSLMRELSYKI